MFFITIGTVHLFHKKSFTYLKELKPDRYFGEIAFFSDLPRSSSAMAREFTETLYLSSDRILTEFSEDRELFKEAIQVFEE